MAASWYTTALYDVGRQAMNLVTGDMRVLLVTSGYTFSAAHDFVNDITNEITTSGVTRQAVTGEAFSIDAPDVKFDVNDISFGAVGDGSQTVAAAVFYLEGGGTDGTRPLVGYHELTTPRVLNGGTFTLEIDADGLLRLELAP